MVAGIERSTLPGPSVMTNIWPMPTMTKKVAKVSAAVSSSPPPWPRGEGDGREPDAGTPRRRTRARAFRAMRRSARHRRFSTRSMMARSASTMIRIAPCAPICQSGGMRRKVEERAGSVSVIAPMHRADRRDAAADELAAAEDHAGDREQRVALGDVGVGRGGEADQRQARRARRRSRRARTSSPWSSAATSRRARSPSDCRRSRAGSTP